MIPESASSRYRITLQRREPRMRIRCSRRLYLIPGVLFLISLLSLSCNQPFQPVTNYKPRLAMYAILFADQSGVYVRLSGSSNSMKGDVTQPVHGADVGMVALLNAYSSADTSNGVPHTVSLKEEFAVNSGDTDYYYYSPTTVLPRMSYDVTASKEGYDSVSAYVTVPGSFVTIPDKYTYTALRLPDSSSVNPNFNVMLNGSSAYFVQLLIEYRGFDSKGSLQSGFVDATGSSPADPFIQVKNSIIPFSVTRLYYASRLAYAKQLAGSLRQSHLYADIVVTQVDDPLYRFYLTSGRWTDPLAMRTDKVVFSNVTNGNGIVGAAAVDTTRIFLF